MQRLQLEHIIRAATGITGAKEIVIIGSQAVLGQFPDAPVDLLASIEADVFTFCSPADADLIEGSKARRSIRHLGITRMALRKKLPSCRQIGKLAW